MTADQNLAPLRPTHSAPAVFGAGAAIGVLGGMIGLGGAEFRLPLLIGLFGFAALSAVILNKAMSLVVVLVALPARLAAVPAADVAARWPVAVNLLAGSLLGAWAGASWAVRMRSTTLYKVLAALMVLMAAALLLTHTTPMNSVALPLWAQIPAGVVAGFGIGVIAAIMGVAGGELLIPTIVLLFGEDIKTAGSLSLLVSLPTMLVAFARYSRDGSFAVLGANIRFTVTMAVGSIAGAVLGGLLLGVFPDLILIPPAGGDPSRVRGQARPTRLRACTSSRPKSRNRSRNPCETCGMDMGRESRWEKDAMTVEIMFALVTAAFLAAIVFGMFLVPALLIGVSEPAAKGVLAVGAVLAVLAAVWRVVRVLSRFDAHRHQGH